MADLFQEIMDDVKADRIGEAWNKHGRWVIYAAISIVLVTAGVVYWSHHKREVAMENTAHYIDAADALGRGDGQTALTALDQIRPAKSSTYYGLVLLKKAEAQKMLGKNEEAKATLTELSARNDVYGDLGKILQGATTKTNDDPDATLTFSRKEWAAWGLLDAGMTKEAATLFHTIAVAEKAPQTLRDRAQMMALHLQQGDSK